VYIKRTTIRIPFGTIAIFGKYVPGALKESDLPKPVVLVDEEDGNEYECELVELVPVGDYIPSIFAWIAENKESTEELEQELFKRLNVSSLKQIAFYLYRHGKPVC
jgi:hypothetical protein